MDFHKFNQKIKKDLFVSSSGPCIRDKWFWLFPFEERKQTNQSRWLRSGMCYKIPRRYHNVLRQPDRFSRPILIPKLVHSYGLHTAWNPGGSPKNLIFVTDEIARSLLMAIFFREYKHSEIVGGLQNGNRRECRQTWFGDVICRSYLVSFLNFTRDKRPRCYVSYCDLLHALEFKPQPEMSQLRFIPDWEGIEVFEEDEAYTASF